MSNGCIPIYIICVLYENYIENIESLGTFLKFKDDKPVKIIVVDNSVSDIYLEKNYQLKNRYTGIKYIANGENIGLSKSYNKAISHISDEQFWVMLADDDTCFTIEYLENAYKVAKKLNDNIIVGIVKTKEGHALSPMLNRQIRYRENNFITSVGEYKNIYAINSGLWIHSSIFKKIGLYPETLFLDMLDFWFFETVKKNELNEVNVVEGKITQDFSGANNRDFESAKIRFMLYKKDFKTFCEICNINYLYRILILFKRSIKVNFFVRFNTIKNKLRIDL